MPLALRLACSSLLTALLVGCTPSAPPLCEGGECVDLAGEADLAAPADLAGADLTGVDLATPPGADLRAADLATPGDMATAPVDPGLPGPLRVLRFDLKVPISPTATLDTTVLGPTDDGATLALGGAPYPLVVVSPGFQLPRGQFVGYGERLASHGFIAVLQTARDQANHAQYRDDSIKLLDWLLMPTGGDAGKIMGRIDAAAVGVAGHSLGGKISLLVAAKDPRVKAVIAIDPVDGGFGMQPQAKDAVKALMLPGGRPIGILGETTSKGGAVACTPPADNYEVLYAAAPSPAFAITFVGAAHADFVDDFMACGLACAVCGGGTAPKTRTRDLARKYVAAYFLKHLRGVASAEDALSGAGFDADRAAGAVTRVAK